MIFIFSYFNMTYIFNSKHTENIIITQTITGRDDLMGERERVGFGEYLPPLSETTIYSPERIMFFKTIQNHANYVWEDLYENVLPITEKILKDAPKNFLFIKWEEIKDELNQELHQFDKVYEAIKDWGECHNLYNDWVYRMAFQILKEYINNDDIESHKDLKFFKFIESKPNQKERKTVSFSIYGWDVLNETKAEFKKRVEEDIKKSLNNRIEEICLEVEEKGFRKTKTQKHEDKFTALVKYQIKEETQMEIVDYFYFQKDRHISVAAISKSIDNAIEMLGLDTKKK